jgi:hypothetical protein
VDKSLEKNRSVFMQNKVVSNTGFAHPLFNLQAIDSKENYWLIHRKSRRLTTTTIHIYKPIGKPGTLKYF